MLGKLIILIVGVATVLFIAGCRAKPECSKPGCRYVYERRVDEPQLPPQQPAADKIDHIMILISASGKTINNSHCAAIFCKVKQEQVLESAVISWMPLSKKTNIVWRGNIEDGVNLDIPSTLTWAKSNGSSLERHGPYYVREDLYIRAKAQEQKLNQGGVKFVANDSPQSRQTGAINNIHAISDILCNGDQFDKFLVTGRYHGRDASGILKNYFDKEGYIDGRYRNENELLKQFDLQAIRRLD